MAEAILYRDVSKVFASDSKAVLALSHIDLAVEENSFTTIVGPSGCGKTTLLRISGGLMSPTSGQVLYKGKPLNGVHREIGFITQDSNLYPWLTLQENVEFALNLRGIPRQESNQKAQGLIQMLGLKGFERHFPSQLSGGMQKRASIARTLIYEPNVILMDEPFGPLDAQTRLILQQELLRIWNQRKKTILFITHDLVEAVALSDLVVILSPRPGRVKAVVEVKIPRPRNVFEIHGMPGFTESYGRVWNCMRDQIYMGTEV